MSMSSNIIIHTHDLRIDFGKNHNVLHVLDGVSFDVNEGELVAIVGPSGCGKSTLLRAIAGLQPITAGHIEVCGTSPEQARLNRLFGVVFQDPVLFPWLTVLENLLMPLTIGPSATLKDISSGKSPEDIVTDILELVGLLGFEDSLPVELSGGMQARVAVARALISSSRILLMDEPFASLDELTRQRMDDEILKIKKMTGCTILFITHTITEAVYLADKIIVFSPLPATISNIIPVRLGERSVEIIDDTLYMAALKETRETLMKNTSKTWNWPLSIHNKLN